MPMTSTKYARGMWLGSSMSLLRILKPCGSIRVQSPAWHNKSRHGSSPRMLVMAKLVTQSQQPVKYDSAHALKCTCAIESQALWPAMPSSRHTMQSSHSKMLSPFLPQLRAPKIRG